MDESSVVADHAVGADQEVVGNRVPEDLHSQSVSYDLLGLFVKIRVDKSNIVIASDAVAEGR